MDDLRPLEYQKTIGWERVNEYTDSKRPAMVMLSRKPLTSMSLRPVYTTAGKIVEYQMLLEGELDYMCLSSDKKPEPGRPVLGDGVVRFHPDDVMV